jgi:Domain of unknown function (DUF4270)
MRWWAKATALSLILLVSLLTACEAPKEIGLPPGALVNVKYTDTLTVRTSTMLLDSVRTSGAIQLLVGNYRDPVFGQIKANTYFEFTQPSLPFVIKEGTTYEYDSAAILVNFNFAYGDTLKPFTFSVHRLTDTLVNKTYYNNSTANFSSKPLAQKTVIPFLSNIYQHILKVPDDFGKEIFSLNGAEEGKTVSAFVRKIKGLTLQSDASNAAILGLSAGGISVRIYFHEKDKTEALVLGLPLSAKRFNNIQSNRQGTVLATLQPLKPQTLKGGNYLQTALGIVTKIEIPYFQNLFKNNSIAINRAELTLTPTLSGNENFRIPSALALTETDETNRILRTKAGQELLLADDGATFSGSIAPQIVGFNNQFKNYNFVLTTYLQALSTGYKNNKGLLLLPIDYNSWQGYISSTNTLPTNFTPYINSQIARMNFDAKNLKLVVFYTETK